eukprot:766761-Hanusia_phi.AAC.2
MLRRSGGKDERRARSRDAKKGRDNDGLVVHRDVQVKAKPGAWPLLLKQDYDPNAADWADRKIISRKEVSKEDVEKALQLLVALMKPSLLEDAPAEVSHVSDSGLLFDSFGRWSTQKAEKEREEEVKESDELRAAWRTAVEETVEEEWEEAARTYREALSKASMATVCCAGAHG